MSRKPFYVSTPIYYCNDIPHIGHAYTTITADVLARYHRLVGDKTFFLTGTDEHGQKVEKAAEALGKKPKEFVDGVVTHFQELWETLNVSNDRFIRTTDEDHKEVVTELWKKMEAAGDIFEGEYEDWYCVHDETFWTESQLLEGNLCPNPWCKRPVEKKREKSYFFKLSKYTEPLLKYYEDHPDFVLPEFRMNEVKSFVSQGLMDLSISRSTINWGIPVPGDEKHVMYVWVDALTNYLTASGYLKDEEKYETFWPATIHLIGKDILRFHAIFWPAFLMSAGLPLPKHVMAHGFWTADDMKISKSLGNRIDPTELVDMFGLDAVRYFLMREIQLGADGNFSYKAIANRVNADLANDLGNLLSRSLAMTKKYMDGVVPDKTAADCKMANVCAQAEADYKKAFDNHMPNKALVATWEVISYANKYIDEQAPWVLAKDDANKQELADTMYNLLEALRRIGAMISPVMPDTSAKLLAQLGLESITVNGDTLGNWGELEPGTKTQRGESLFPRVDMKKVEKLIESKAAEAEKKKADSKAESKTVEKQEPENIALVEFTDFTKLALRIGVVKTAEKVKKTDKLLKLTVDTGEDRTIVAGIALHYTPEELIGKKVVVLTNLKPRKLRGIESEGMMLAATAPDGTLRLLTTDEIIPAGSTIG